MAVRGATLHSVIEAHPLQIYAPPDIPAHSMAGDHRVRRQIDMTYLAAQPTHPMHRVCDQVGRGICFSFTTPPNPGAATPGPRPGAGHGATAATDGRSF